MTALENKDKISFKVNFSIIILTSVRHQEFCVIFLKDTGTKNLQISEQFAIQELQFFAPREACRSE